MALEKRDDVSYAFVDSNAVFLYSPQDAQPNLEELRALFKKHKMIASEIKKAPLPTP